MSLVDRLGDFAGAIDFEQAARTTLDDQHAPVGQRPDIPRALAPILSFDFSLGGNNGNLVARRIGAKERPGRLCDRSRDETGVDETHRRQGGERMNWVMGKDASELTRMRRRNGQSPSTVRPVSAAM